MVDVPDGVNVTIAGKVITAKGPGGEVHKTFAREVSVKLNGKKLEVESERKELLGTTVAIIKGMMVGASVGYKRTFKLIYAHFPITVEVKGKDVTIKNFLGEKQARKTVLIGNTRIDAKGQNVTISGPDKHAVGQTIANMRTAMRIKDKDSRVFQDGLYDVAGE